MLAQFPSRQCVGGLAVLSVFFINSFVAAAVKVRFYPGGEADAGATVGGVALATEDILEPPTEDANGDPVFDNEGDFVELTALANSEAPTYALGRDGQGSLSLDFDGVDDLLGSGPFDPRNFSTFAALSQAWVNPDPSGAGSDQFLWSLGTDNGGVGITADGFWQLRASNGAPDTTTEKEVVFGQWTQVAVFRGGNDARLFIDGEQVTRRDAVWFGVGPVSVGSGADGENPFDGQIDDFNIAGFSDLDFDVVRDVDFFDPDNFSNVTGDVDQDGTVDMSDYVIWSDNVGFDNEQGSGDAITLLRGDVDGNGRVNYFDFQIIAQEAAAAGAPLNLEQIPEPSSFVLMSLGLGFAIFSLRRRANS